jgi:hypothetical protein
MIDDDRGLLGRSGELVPATSGMMMRDTLVAVRGYLVAVPLVMTGGLCSFGNANDPLGGMRQSARPQHEDKRERAKEGLQPDHQ